MESRGQSKTQSERCSMRPVKLRLRFRLRLRLRLRLRVRLRLRLRVRKQGTRCSMRPVRGSGQGGGRMESHTTICR